MKGFHVAQLNVGRSVAPLDDPVMAGFMDRLADINALGERSPGYVWRLQGETGNATTIHAYDDPRMIINLTVWESIEDLYAFAYRSQHMEVFRRRREWFEQHDGPSLVLWWVPAGEPPTPAEARLRLELLAARADARCVHAQDPLRSAEGECGRQRRPRAAKRSLRRYHSPTTGRNHGLPS